METNHPHPKHATHLTAFIENAAWTENVQAIVAFAREHPEVQIRVLANNWACVDRARAVVWNSGLARQISVHHSASARVFRRAG